MAEKKSSQPRDIRAIIILLATQSLIGLGEINDPLIGGKRVNLGSAALFADLLTELQNKTKGNLTADEEKFLDDVAGNLKFLLKKRMGDRHG